MIDWLHTVNQFINSRLEIPIITERNPNKSFGRQSSVSEWGLLAGENDNDELIKQKKKKNRRLKLTYYIRVDQVNG